MIFWNHTHTQKIHMTMNYWRDGKSSHTTLVMTSKELSSNGSLGFKFRSCTTYSVRTCDDDILIIMNLFYLLDIKITHTFALCRDKNCRE